MGLNGSYGIYGASLSKVGCTPSYIRNIHFYGIIVFKTMDDKPLTRWDAHPSISI